MKTINFLKLCFSSKAGQLGFIFLFLSGVCFIPYFYSPLGWSLSELCLSLAVALLQFSLCLFIVSSYLEKEAEKEKERELEKAKRERNNAIKDIQNILKNDILAVHCVLIKSLAPHVRGEEYSNLRDNLNRMDFVSKQIKDNYIRAVKDNHQNLIKHMDICMQQIKMLMSTGLFNSATENSESDEGPYFWCLGANRVFIHFKNAKLDDTNETDDIIKNCETFIESLLSIAERIIPGSKEEHYKELLKLTVKK